MIFEQLFTGEKFTLVKNGTQVLSKTSPWAAVYVLGKKKNQKALVEDFQEVYTVSQQQLDNIQTRKRMNAARHDAMRSVGMVKTRYGWE